MESVAEENPWAYMGVPMDDVARSVVEEKKWEECMCGCGVWLKAGGWGVCSGCYRKGHKGRTEECSDGFVLCRGCGVHVKASVGACKPCLKIERQANGIQVEDVAPGMVLCRGGCGAHVKATRGVCKPCAKAESEASTGDMRSPSPAGRSVCVEKLSLIHI